MSVSQKVSGKSGHDLLVGLAQAEQEGFLPPHGAGKTGNLFLLRQWEQHDRSNLS
ncbi:hypothetical protein AA0472_1619 [Acetobacter estunensis NRIC 0472]|nr:hypothetical protein AA0472_1619 [Acetobacter estunensis NRIC 0472]